MLKHKRRAGCKATLRCYGFCGSPQQRPKQQSALELCEEAEVGGLCALAEAAAGSLYPVWQAAEIGRLMNFCLHA